MDHNCQSEGSEISCNPSGSATALTSASISDSDPLDHIHVNDLYWLFVFTYFGSLSSEVHPFKKLVSNCVLALGFLVTLDLYWYTVYYVYRQRSYTYTCGIIDHRQISICSGEYQSGFEIVYIVYQKVNICRINICIDSVITLCYDTNNRSAHIQIGLWRIISLTQ